MGDHEQEAGDPLEITEVGTVQPDQDVPEEIEERLRDDDEAE